MASEPASPPPSPAAPARTSRSSPWTWLPLAAALALPILWLVNRFVARPNHLGPVHGRLAGCPDSPNCVASQSEDPAHHIEPLATEGPSRRSIPRLRRLLTGRSRVRLVTETDIYLHYEFVTPVCRFVDDVEFLADETQPVIHVRSASRIGHSDLGTNRRRIEELRREWDHARHAPTTP